jgi:hypothetical protein
LRTIPSLHDRGERDDFQTLVVFRIEPDLEFIRISPNLQHHGGERGDDGTVSPDHGFRSFRSADTESARREAASVRPGRG